MVALAGAGVGAAVGGLTGALIRVGIRGYEARQHDESMKGGNIPVSARQYRGRIEDRSKSKPDDALRRGSGGCDLIGMVFRRARCAAASVNVNIIIPRVTSRTVLVLLDRTGSESFA
jgi:hypothetical protein